jgi:hypothetical protein
MNASVQQIQTENALLRNIYNFETSNYLLPVMKRYLFSMACLWLLLSSCNDEVIKKPPELISRDQMIAVLVDIHLADAAFQTRRYSSEELKDFSESDVYYSVLKKYKLADSVFETSLIYYAGKPKEFEKIYTRVINKLSEMEQEEEKKNQQPVNIQNPKKE